jgi:plasmid stabilization system protein ParE
MGRYQFTPQGVDDLFEIWSYIARDSRAAAEWLSRRKGKFNNDFPLAWQSGVEYT